MLSLALQCPVIVFLRDIGPEIDVMPKAYDNTRLVFIGCHSLDWDAPRLVQEKSIVYSSLIGREVPLPQDIDYQGFKEQYLAKANVFHAKYRTHIKPVEPISTNPSPFDYSVCAFLGKHLSGDNLIGQYVERSTLEVKRHLLWAATIQLYTNVHFHIAWLGDQSVWKSFNNSLFICFNTKEETVTFCHSLVARHIFENTIKSTEAFNSLGKLLKQVPNNILERLLFERHRAEFSPFITRLRSAESLSTIKMILNVVEDMELEIKCHLKILVSRLILRTDYDSCQERLQELLATNDIIQKVESIAQEALINAEDLDDISHRAIALAHLGYIYKTLQSWDLASNYYRQSLQVQPTRWGAMQSLITVNCNLLDKGMDVTTWIHTVQAFYSLSVEDPKRCYSLPSQLNTLNRLKPERDKSNGPLQIAFLQLLAIQNVRIEQLTPDDLFNTNEMSGSLQRALAILCPCYKEHRADHEISFKDQHPGQFHPFQSSDNYIPVYCVQPKYPKWLWSTTGWIPIHNRQFWYIDEHAYDAYKTTAAKLMQLTAGATLLSGIMHPTRPAVLLNINTTSSPLESPERVVDIGMYCHVLPSSGSGVLCYIGLVQEQTEDTLKLQAWVIEENYL